MQKLRKIVLDEDLPEEIKNEFILFEARTLPDGTPMDEPGKKGDHSPDAFRYSENEAIREGAISVEDDDDLDEDMQNFGLDSSEMAGIASIDDDYT